MIRARDTESVFALALYAEAQFRPLVDQLPGGAMHIYLNLGGEYLAEFKKEWSLSFSVREGTAQDHPGEGLVFSGLIDSSEENDHEVQRLRQRLARDAA